MATNNFRLSDMGNFALSVVYTERGCVDEYRGTAEALISAGLVRADQLPGQPDMPKSCATFYDGRRIRRGMGTYGKRDEKYMHVLTAGKKFTIWKGVAAEVAAERNAAWDAKIDADRKAERLAAAVKELAYCNTQLNRVRAEGVLYNMVNSADEYRKKMVKELQSCVRGVRSGDMLPNDNHGFSVDESVVTELDDLLNEMIELITNADVRFNAPRHKEINLKCKSDIAKADSRFQRTLNHLQQSAPESTIGEAA